MKLVGMKITLYWYEIHTAVFAVCISMFDMLIQPRCDCPQYSILNPPTKSDLACRLADRVENPRSIEANKKR